MLENKYSADYDRERQRDKQTDREKERGTGGRREFNELEEDEIAKKN